MLSRKAEDYLEASLNITEEKGYKGKGYSIGFRYSALKRCRDAKEFCAVCEVRIRLATMASALQNVL